MSYAIILLFFMGFMATPHLVLAEVCNRVVAIVNDELITLHELNTRIKDLTGLEPESLRLRDEKDYLKTRREILEFLVDEKIANEKIRELRIEITPENVDAAVEKIKRDNNFTQEDLIANLRSQGTNYEAYRKNIQNDLKRLQLINVEVKSKIIITEEKIKEYYNQHKAKFRNEGKVHLATIFLKQKGGSSRIEDSPVYRKAKEIVMRARNGEDFAGLARRYSEGPGTQDGGDLGFFKTDQLDPELSRIIKDMPIGGVSEPIARPSGMQIIKLVERQERRQKSLDEVREAIYAILFREEVDKSYSLWIKELREKAYVKIIF